MSGRVLKAAFYSTAGIICVAAFALLFGLLLVQSQQLEGTQEVEKWTAESHDRTNFPLVGKHRTVTCRECHLDGVFEGTPIACEACHWARRQDDRYALQLGIHCANCHESFSWKQVAPNKWNHETETGYLLQGIHRTLDCAECHKEEGFRGASADCFRCHEKDYSESRNLDHRAAGFSTACQECHLSSAWQGAVYSHRNYLLAGQHVSATCSDCHRSGQYAGLPLECVFCHQADYDRAMDPNHRESGFPLFCEVCHGTDAITWEGAVFTHSKFPLKGQHRSADCLACHSSGQYQGLPSVCVFCHLEDYLNARNPDHKQLGFHTNCEVCHGTDAVTWKNAKMSRAIWAQVRFDHAFPIDAGKHSRWECSDCHVSANYRDFSCLSCHGHDKARMDKDHRGVPGYSYNSQSCYACHPQGRE